MSDFVAGAVVFVVDHAMVYVVASCLTDIVACAEVGVRVISG